MHSTGIPPYRRQRNHGRFTTARAAAGKAHGIFATVRSIFPAGGRLPFIRTKPNMAPAHRNFNSTTARSGPPAGRKRKPKGSAATRLKEKLQPIDRVRSLLAHRPAASASGGTGAGAGRGPGAGEREEWRWHNLRWKQRGGSGQPCSMPTNMPQPCRAFGLPPPRSITHPSDIAVSSRRNVRAPRHPGRSLDSASFAPGSKGRIMAGNQS